MTAASSVRLLMLGTLAVLSLTGCPSTGMPRRALMVVQPHFNAAEYSEPRSVLEEIGLQIQVASITRNSIAAYAEEMTLQPDLLVEDVAVEEYDIIVFVGGYPYNAEREDFIRLAQVAGTGDRIVAGICNGVITMANSGMLTGVSVAALTYHPASALEGRGAVLVEQPVVQDGRFITASGPDASMGLGEQIRAALEV